MIEELGTKVITNEQGGVSFASYPLDSKKEELYRVFLYDNASEDPGAIRVWPFTTKEEALKAAEEVCERLKDEKDFMRNLFRYTVTVHHFYGTNLESRSVFPLFDSMKEYPCNA